MAYDPFRSYYGHPILPAGYNSAPNDGDEVDGAGYNEPIWPLYVDTFVELLVILITEPMMEAFDSECPDFAPGCEDDTIRFPAEYEVITIRGKAA